MYAPITVLTLLFIGSFHDNNMCWAQPCYEDINQQVISTYPECANKPGANFTAPFETFLRDLVCDPTCGPLFNATFYRLCPSPSISDLQLANYYLSQCRVNENGQACYSFYNNSEIDMSVANSTVLQLCSTSAQGACSDQCKDQLMAIRNYYGVCVNSVFNSSYFRTFYDLVPLFSYQLWTNCGVPVPVIGGGDTVTTPSLSSAMASLKVVAMLAMLCAMLAIWIMH